jgi:hypothetical protein
MTGIAYNMDNVRIVLMAGIAGGSVAGIEVNPEAVVATAGSLKPLATDVAGPGTRISGLPALAEAPLSTALESMKSTWSKALQLLGQDVGLCADKVSKAGVTYSVTEQQIHDSFGKAVKDPVDFTPASRPPGGGRRAE